MNENEVSIVVGFLCKDQEQAARVIESIGRQIAGLALDGVIVSVMRNDSAG